MGFMLSIPAIVKSKKTEIILEPEKNMGELIQEYMGSQARDIYLELVQKEETEDCSVYRDDLIEVRNKLKKILEKERVSRKAIQELYEEVSVNLI